jgi:site-specific recombinase XerC
MEMKKTPSGADGKKPTNAVTGIVQDVNRKGISERDLKKKNENMKHINSVLDKDKGNTFKLEESRGIDEPKKTTYIPRQPAVEYLLKIEQ